MNNTIAVTRAITAESINLWPVLRIRLPPTSAANNTANSAATSLTADFVFSFKIKLTPQMALASMDVSGHYASLISGSQPVVTSSFASSFSLEFANTYVVKPGVVPLRFETG